MSEVLKLIGVDYELWRATDGKLLQNEEFAADVVPLPGYEDPYHKRPMKAGEVEHRHHFRLTLSRKLCIRKLAYIIKLTYLISTSSSRFTTRLWTSLLEHYGC